MSGLTLRVFAASDEAAVVSLWAACGLLRPWNDPKKDIERKSKVQPDLFLVALEEAEVVGAVMAGYEGHRGWINYLAVSPQHWRKGIGRALMAEAERRLQALGCPKINLQVRVGNEAVQRFYESIGYARDEVVSLGKRLEPGG